MKAVATDHGHAPFEHVLVMHSGALGDTILMLSLVGALNHAGISHVSLLCRGQYRPLTEMCPGAGECHDIDTGGYHSLFCEDSEIPRDVSNFIGRHDAVVNMLPDPTHTVRNRLQQIGVQTVAEIDPASRDDFRGHITEKWLADFRLTTMGGRLALPNIPPAPRLELKSRSEQATDVSDGVGVAPTISRHDTAAKLPGDAQSRVTLIHPGSGSRVKCWPLTNFIDLAHRLIEQERRVAFLVGPVERERFDKAQIRALGQTAPIISTDDLCDLAEILATTETVVANDSGIAHLAAALDARVVAIFGPSDPVKWRPLGLCVTVRHAPPLWSSVESVAGAV